MSEFKVGQRVWDFRHGWGTVACFTDRAIYLDGPSCFEVRTDSGKYFAYNQRGQSDENTGRTLFFEEVPIPDSALKPKFEPDFVKGNMALIYDVKMDRKFIRVVAEDQRHEDRIECYSDGNINGDEREWFERGPAWLFTKINNK